MGYKDEKWREAPGYCVECDNLRPLNRCAVCEECWNAHPGSDYERWEEHEYYSHWYYDRMKEASGREFIIFGDGTGHRCCLRKDFKIFGTVDADSAEEAFEKWLRIAHEFHSSCPRSESET